MDEADQSPEELEAHFAEDGPVAASREWLSTIFERNDLLAAWRKTDLELRQVLVQAWIWANRSHPLIVGLDRENLASELARSEPSHPLWRFFEESQLREFKEVWGELNLDRLGAASRPRPIAPDYELVIWLDTKGDVLHIEQPPFEEDALVLLMRSTPEGWLVAGLGSEEVPEPGWPPKQPKPPLAA
jgi:hypothetical protein